MHLAAIEEDLGAIKGGNSKSSGEALRDGGTCLVETGSVGSDTGVLMEN